MRRRSTKIAAALLSAMLVLQSGIGTANMSLVQRVQAAEQTTEAAVQTQAETQIEVQTQALTEAQTQAPTEAPTEAQTQAPTEAQTQAPTEAQTQAPTEAQTQAPTEAQTQAPTEAQTQAPTEAQTQAPTEVQTQAPTEAQTQASTEAQTQKQSEKETEKETATEPAETERSERVNAGSKMKASQLTSSLKNVLPYLLAAKTVQLPDQLVEALGVDASEENEENTLVLQGDEGAAATAELKQFALKLADAKTSSNVKVINLYADKDGKLDTAQLDQQFKNQIIDVTKQYVVINVIADHADQNLTFSGYDMVLSGSSVKYQDETQPGDILYNFAALDGEKYTAYKGTLTLSGNLQGTFLAPEADVKINADLAGAVFAESITVADSVESLLHIVFAEGKDTESETAEVTEAVTESETAKETEAVIENETAEATEAAIESETAEETEVVTESETAKETETATESETVKETETATESEVAKETEAATEIVSETEKISETVQDEELVDLLIEQEVEPIQPVALTPQGEGETVQETTLTLSVIDEEGKVVPSAVFVVKDQDKKVLTDEQGQPLYYISYAGTETNLKMDLDLKKLVEQIKDTESHTYYLSQLRTAAGYQIDTMEHSFTIENGTVFFAKTKNAENTENQDEISFTYVRELTIQNKKIQQTAQAGTLKITGKTYYKNVLLTGEQPNTRYVALFADEELTRRVSAVLPLEYEPGKTETGTAEFAELASQEAERTYYLAQTDEFGTVIPAEEEEAVVQAEGENAEANRLDYQIWVGDAAGSKIEFAQQTEESNDTEPKQAHIDFYLDQIGYTAESGYSYPAELTVTKKIFDAAGAALPTDETFYFNVYPIEAGKTELGKAVFEKPQAIVMKQSAEASTTVSLKMNAASGSFAIREVDQSGTILTADSTGFVYTISYPENPDGTFTVFCNSAVDDNGQFTGVTEPVKLTIENRRTDSVVKLQAEDKGNGKLLSGISLVVKNKAGKVVLINDKKVMTSAAEPIELKNVLTIGETYYLSALQAPSGYAAAPDVAFTVGRSGETIVSLQYSPIKTTEYKLTLSKQVYQGKYPLYAYDSDGKYAAKGVYTFYAALFADSARTQKVSDVQKITVSGFAGTTDFMNLEKDKTYYIGETDEYGQLQKSTSEVAVKYAAKGVVTMSEKSKTSVIQNAYSSRPEGYRYTGTLTIVKKVTDAAGNAASVNETFYAGIYRNADYSDKPEIVKLECQNASSASKKKIIGLSGSKDMVYYIAEVDAKGNRITDSSDFAYTVKIDQPTATISKGTNTTVTITNQAKSTKATLYLTKKVYNGTEQQTVNETFYAGLFKDAAFTKPYTKPIAMKLENKSELTLKLSLNLGTASSTKIYIAEVDADGNVIKDEKNFGYQIRMVNSTVEFTQERREVQTIILNSKYGTTSSNDWNDIFDKDGNDGGSMDGGYWGVSGNGDASESTAAQTGDDTPILFYGLLMCLALVVLIVLLVFFRKKRN